MIVKIILEESFRKCKELLICCGSVGRSSEIRLKQHHQCVVRKLGIDLMFSVCSKWKICGICNENIINLIIPISLVTKSTKA